MSSSHHHPKKIEIERKFLVKNNTYRQFAEGKYYCQGYLNDDTERVVRVRIIEEKGYVTIKGKGTGITRPEFEYEIPFDDARFLLDNLCYQPLIEKYRYKVPQGELCWEIDEFLGENKGLIIAEIELPDEQCVFEKPDWIGKEVTFIPDYYNVNLIKHPYKKW